MIQRRTTDAEEIKSEVEARHKEEIQRRSQLPLLLNYVYAPPTGKDSLIQELTGQLSKQSPSSSSQSWTLHFLTREAAEEEKRALRDENTRLKDVIKQHNAVVAAKDQQVVELKQEGISTMYLSLCCSSLLTEPKWSLQRRSFRQRSTAQINSRPAQCPYLSQSPRMERKLLEVLQTTCP